MAKQRSLKILSWLILIFLFATPFLFAIWWIFPVLVVLAIRGLWRLSKNESFSGFTKPAAILIFLGFVVWLYFVPRKETKLPPRSYLESGPKLLLQPAVAPDSPDSARISATQQFLANASQIRLELTRVASARTYYNDALVWRDYLAGTNQMDPEKLTTSLEKLKKDIAALRPSNAPASSTADDSVILKKYTDDATQVLDTRVKEVKDGLRSGSLSAADIVARTNQLADVLDANSLQTIWGDRLLVDGAVENAGRTGIGLPQSSYSARYNRATDTLTATQTTTIDLIDRGATNIDLSNLFIDFGDPSLTQEITAQEDSIHGASNISRSDPIHAISATSRHITIINSVFKPKASYPLIYRPIPSTFRAIDTGWPLPTSFRVQVTVRVPNSAAVFPVSIVVIAPPGPPTGMPIGIPRDSFFYSQQADLLGDINTQEYDQAVPNQKAPALSEMYGGSTIHLELLPSYLSNPFGQKYKQFLVFENLAVTLGIAVVCSLLLALIEWKH